MTGALNTYYVDNKPTIGKDTASGYTYDFTLHFAINLSTSDEVFIQIGFQTNKNIDFSGGYRIPLNNAIFIESQVFDNVTASYHITNQNNDSSSNASFDLFPALVCKTELQSLEGYILSTIISGDTSSHQIISTFSLNDIVYPTTEGPGKRFLDVSLTPFVISLGILVLFDSYRRTRNVC